MPKIYEYLGILIFFYSNEHEPIHVHARKGENESKAEFIIKDGEISEIIIKNVAGISPLKKPELKKFKEFLSIFGQQCCPKMD